MADLNRILAVKNGSVAFAPSAIAAAQTYQVDKDERTFLYVNNAQAGASTTITIPKGNGIAGVSDLTVVVPQASAVIIGPLESAKYADKLTGKITVNASVTTSTTIALVTL
jgi:hypothetical protein